MLVTRVSSLAAHFKETLRHFQELCVTAKVVGEDDHSLENCLVGLKEALAVQKIELKVRPASSSSSSSSRNSSNYHFNYIAIIIQYLCTRHSVGTYHGNKVTRNSSGSTWPAWSQHAEPQ